MYHGCQPIVLMCRMGGYTAHLLYAGKITFSMKGRNVGKAVSKTHTVSSIMRWGRPTLTLPHGLARGMSHPRKQISRRRSDWICRKVFLSNALVWCLLLPVTPRFVIG